MKNIFKSMLLVAIATFTFSSCNKDNTPAVQEKTVLDFTMDYANFSGNDTKATKKNWANGDLVYLVFKQGTGDFDWQNYVKMQYNGSGWVVLKGQDVLDALSDGTGYVNACHHTGIEDPVLNSSSTEYVFTKTGEYTPDSHGFATSAYGVRYSKTSNKISADLKFKLKEDFQFNIKGLDFADNKYELLILKGTTDVTRGNFGCFIFSKTGLGFINGENTRKAQEGINPAVKEITFFTSLYKNKLTSEDYTTDATTSLDTYSFNPTFKLGIKIDGSLIFIQRTITGKSITQYKAYSLDGPTATDAEIKRAVYNQDLGNGWTKM